MHYQLHSSAVRNTVLLIIHKNNKTNIHSVSDHTTETVIKKYCNMFSNKHVDTLNLEETVDGCNVLYNNQRL